MSYFKIATAPLRGFTLLLYFLLLLLLLLLLSFAFTTMSSHALENYGGVDIQLRSVYLVLLVDDDFQACALPYVCIPDGALSSYLDLLLGLRSILPWFCTSRFRTNCLPACTLLTYVECASLLRRTTRCPSNPRCDPLELTSSSFQHLAGQLTSSWRASPRG